MIAAIGIFFVFLLLGMPVAFAIGISGWSFFMIRELPLSIMVQKSISTTQSFTMLAIPLFILEGNLMNATGITKRLITTLNVSYAFVTASVPVGALLMIISVGTNLYKSIKTPVEKWGEKA